MRKDILLIKRVKEEARNLKKHATPAELYNLNFSSLLWRNSYQCIYGQTTGYCYSDRANELIRKCADKVYKKQSSASLSSGDHKLNGRLPKGASRGLLGYYSPIEIFISQPENQEVNNKILIDFLQGKRKDLRFVYPKKRG